MGSLIESSARTQINQLSSKQTEDLQFLKGLAVRDPAWVLKEVCQAIERKNPPKVLAYALFLKLRALAEVEDG